MRSFLMFLYGSRDFAEITVKAGAEGEDVRLSFGLKAGSASAGGVFALVDRP